MGSEMAEGQWMRAAAQLRRAPVHTFKMWLPFPRWRKLRWALAFIDRTYAEPIRTARQERDINKVHELQHDRRFERQMLTDEYDDAETLATLDAARRLRIPIVEGQYGEDDNEYWWVTHTSGKVLTDVGFGVMRERIRAERKARAEIRALYLPWLASGVGLVGALTGLMAVWPKPEKATPPPPPIVIQLPPQPPSIASSK